MIVLLVACLAWVAYLILSVIEADVLSQSIRIHHHG